MDGTITYTCTEDSFVKNAFIMERLHSVFIKVSRPAECDKLCLLLTSLMKNMQEYKRLCPHSVKFVQNLFSVSILRILLCNNKALLIHLLPSCLRSLMPVGIGLCTFALGYNEFLSSFSTFSLFFCIFYVLYS